MLAKVVHKASGICIGFFVVIHLLNHLWSIFGVEDHIHMMNSLRVYYRNPIAETLLLVSIVIQMISGIKLYALSRAKAKSGFEKIQQWTGLYLLVFLVIHVSAVLGARMLFHLDTNFYFGVVGINTFPLNLFFIPYYAMATISFFGHLAAIHAIKMRYNIAGFRPAQQATIIIIIGVAITFVLFYGFTNKFRGVVIPESYSIFSNN
jgi:hypothetical protein